MMEPHTFLQTLTYDVLEPHEYGDISGVSDRLKTLEPVIKQMEEIDSETSITTVLSSEPGMQLAALLLGIRSSDLRSREQRDTLLPLLDR